MTVDATKPTDTELIKNWPEYIRAIAAEVNSVAAVALTGYDATSLSNVTIVSSGLVTFTIETGKAFQIGQSILLADEADPLTNYMWGQVTSYDPVTGILIVSVLYAKGSGTIGRWAISISTNPDTINWRSTNENLSTTGSGTFGGGVTANLTGNVTGNLTGTFASAVTVTSSDTALLPKGSTSEVLLADLQIISTPKTTGSIYVSGRTVIGDGYEGTFGWNSSDLSAEVTNDPQHGIYVAPNGQTGSGGAWVRQYKGLPYPEWFGGATSSAVQAALNFSGKLQFVPGGTYNLGAITYTGKVIIHGNGATINSDVVTFTITNGSGSLIKDINFGVQTLPYTFVRDPNTFAIISQGYSLNGYQPTINDGSDYTALTSAQQTQNIGGGIRFQSSGTIQTNINIEGITGNFVTIYLDSVDNSEVKNCTIKGGKGTVGSVVVWGVGTLAGHRNKVTDCKVSYSSYSGITFGNQYDGQITGNNCSFNGESGIKTNQGAGGTGLGYTAHGTLIDGNTCYANLYDGIDAQATYIIIDPTYSNYNKISHNICWGNNATGLIVNGANNSIEGNVLRHNGLSGILATIDDSIVAGNLSVDNNWHNIGSGQHQIAVVGTSLAITNTAYNPNSNSGYNYYFDSAAIIGVNYQLEGQDSIYTGTSTTNVGCNTFQEQTVTVNTSVAGRTALVVNNQQNNAAASASATLSAFGGTWNLDCMQSATSSNRLSFKFNTNELFWIAPGNLCGSPLFYSSTSAAAANAVIQNDGSIVRSTSSRRYKTDITDSIHGLEEVMKLRPVTYKGLNDGDSIFGGLIAEEVDSTGLTEFVTYDSEGRPDSLQYGHMVSLLVKAIQELKTELDKLKSRYFLIQRGSL